MDSSGKTIWVIVIIMALIVVISLAVFIYSGNDLLDGLSGDRDRDDDGFPDNEDEFPKDPTEWEDWDNDTIGDNEDPFVSFNKDSPNFYIDIHSNGPITSSIAYRTIPSANSLPVDRFYYVGGEKDSITAPYGLYAKSSSDGSKVWQGWSGAFETNSEISSNIGTKNFGHRRDSSEMDFRLLFGTESGLLYLIQDDLNAMYPPSGSDVFSVELDAKVNGVAIFDCVDRELGYDDLFFASTDAGTLYILDGNFNFLSNISVTASPLSAPALSSDGQYVYVGSQDGKLYGFHTVDGTQIGTEYALGIDEWTTDPVIGSDLVYAAGTDGVMHCLTTEDCQPHDNWENGIQLVNSEDEEETGKLTTPYIRPDGAQGYVGSGSGWFYGFDNEGNIGSSLNTYGKIEAAPFFDHIYSRLIFVPVNFDNWTSDPSDDFCRVFCYDSAFSFKYSIRLEGQTYGQPVVYDDYIVGSSQHPGEGEVVIGTSTNIYSFRATGG